MKHIEILLFILLGGLMAACDSTIHIYPDPQPSLVVLQLDINRSAPLLYKSVTYDSICHRSERLLSNSPSITGNIPDGYLMRITVEVHDASVSKSRQPQRVDQTTLVSRRMLFANPYDVSPQDTLHYYLPDGDYFAVAWADYVPADNPYDWYFDTSDINDIVFDPNNYPSNPYLRSSECGSCEFSIDFSLSPEGYPTSEREANRPVYTRKIPLNISQPAGRFRIIASDFRFYRDIINSCSVKVVYRQFVSTGYSPVRNSTTEIISSYDWSSPLFIEPYTLGGCLSTDKSIITDYIFANPTRETRIIADFYFFDANGNCFNQCIGVEIPIYQNRETIVHGNFLTSSPNQKKGNNGVNIDEGFDGENIIQVTF